MSNILTEPWKVVVNPAEDGHWGSVMIVTEAAAVTGIALWVPENASERRAYRKAAAQIVAVVNAQQEETRHGVRQDHREAFGETA